MLRHWMHSMMAKQPKASTAVKWRDQTIIRLVEAIGRERPLNEFESNLMDRTVRRLTPRREIWRWSEKEDRTLRNFIKRIAKIGRPRPFEGDDEVRQLAESMGRTYWAVHRRIERLRKKENIKPVKFYRASIRRAFPAKNEPMPFVMPEGYVGIDDAAALLAVPVTWLNRLRKVGGGPAYVRISRRVCYDLARLKRFPAQQLRDEAVASRERLKDAIHHMIDEYEGEIGRKCSDAPGKRKA